MAWRAAGGGGGQVAGGPAHGRWVVADEILGNAFWDACLMGRTPGPLGARVSKLSPGCAGPCPHGGSGTPDRSLATDGLQRW